jgi:isochorismate synthase/2-succinyl-5-enolpyruvyl-6-hydroxy-3-cyclohexene-1-carboxylate synthase/2-succinyl-6-hydroxy-2,4-cyclohexadiene-1-carboxylate synthase/O-succinylbenzoate synthase
MILIPEVLLSRQISGAVLISGSPGLRDEANKRRRTAIDKSRAQFLLSSGLECFIETWYSGKMWAR